MNTGVNRSGFMWVPPRRHVACKIRRRWSGTLGLGGCWPLSDRVLSGGQAVRVSMVLVVEDEALVRLTICEGLASEGYEVLSAATADEAIEILESRNDISTVFTDVEMPGSMDGLKLAAAGSMAAHQHRRNQREEQTGRHADAQEHSVHWEAVSDGGRYEGLRRVYLTGCSAQRVLHPSSAASS
jgi:hypothetical protein